MTLPVTVALDTDVNHKQSTKDMNCAYGEIRQSTSR